MKIKIKADIAVSETGLVFNPRTGESFSVNPMGLELLKLIRQGMDSTRLREIVLAGYDTDPDTFDRDLEDFLLTLVQHHLADEI
jgi:hypothetical protein